MEKEGGEGKYMHMDLTERVIRCAINAHAELGPGLLESIYEEAMAIELADANLSFQRQVEMPVVYKGHRMNGNYRADIVVENTVVLELKSVQLMNPVFEAQLLTYMKLGGWRVGLVLNFGLSSLREGLKRLVL